MRTRSSQLRKQIIVTNAECKQRFNDVLYRVMNLYYVKREDI